MLRTVLLTVLLCGSAHAQIVVNGTLDTLDNDGVCTLREAILSANTDSRSGSAAGECAAGSGADIIRLAVPPGGTILLTGDLPIITQSVSIEGPASGRDGVTIDGADAYAVLEFDSGGGGLLSLRALTITRGLSASGGAVLLGYRENCIFEDVGILANTATSGGGGVYTGQEGSCTMDRVFVHENETGGFSGGGGIRVGNSASLVIRNSTVSNNRTTQSGGAGILIGCFSEPAASFLMEQSTVSGNVAAGTGGGVSQIGSFCPSVIRASTITNNESNDVSGGGGGVSFSSEVSFTSTIITGNRSARDPVWADLSLGNNNTTSGGGNFIGINGFFTSEFPLGQPNANGDFVGSATAPQSAMLGALAPNSGAMPTHLPLAGSSVLDAGRCVGLVLDQRGGPRELEVLGAPNLGGDACDAGAVEGTTQAVDAAEAPGFAALALSPPYPSPTRGSSAVRFELGQAGPVRLVLLDILGREVAILREGNLAAGEHVAPIRPGRLPAGAYLIRLSASGTTATQRLTVTR